MAWIWWLLAPVASTVLGASVLWWFGRHEQGRSSRPGRGGDAMRQHRALLDALAQPRLGDPVPVTMQVHAAD
jgi:membrane protein YqaA with SNARE-associated domain